MTFNELNTNELDKNLTREERDEWNLIYASFRAGSLLSGVVSGVDSYQVNNSGNSILAAVVIPYRVKILIPETLLWRDVENTSKNLSKNLLGAKIDFVIQEIDRENNFCIASRLAAKRIRRKKFFSESPKIGDRIECKVLAIGRRQILVDACGFDITLPREDLCHAQISELRLKYKTGQILPAIITDVGYKENVLSISVRDAIPDPYVGLKNRHPLNSRRAAVISGKYKGSIFCRLEPEVDCLCNYSEYQSDDDFEVGDNVIIVIREYVDSEKRVYGVIVSKWN